MSAHSSKLLLPVYLFLLPVVGTQICSSAPVQPRPYVWRVNIILIKSAQLRGGGSVMLSVCHYLYTCTADCTSASCALLQKKKKAPAIRVFLTVNHVRSLRTPLPYMPRKQDE